MSTLDLAAPPRVTVPPEGDPSRDTWLVGEAPGAEETREGRPFVGRSGRELDRLLAASGTLRSRCHLRNVCPYQPDAHNDFGALYHDAKRCHPTDELRGHWATLRAAVAKYQPALVVLLGREALQGLLHGSPALVGGGSTTVTDAPPLSIVHHRGSVYQVGPATRAVPVFHPAFVMRQRAWFHITVKDLVKARWELRHPAVPLPVTDPWVRPTLAEVQDACNRCLASNLVAFDIETIPEARVITAVSLSWAPGVGVSVPLFFEAPTNPYSPSYWSPTDEPEVLSMIQAALTTGNPLAAHNAVYDTGWLRWRWGLPVDFSHPDSIDTMLAHHDLWPTLPKTLAFVVSLYTRYPYHKGLSASGGYLAGWEYSALDAITCRAAAVELRPLLAREHMTHHYRHYCHDVIDAAAQISQHGLLVDRAARAAAVATETTALAETEASMRTILAAPGFNPRSPKQAATALYTTLGFPRQYHPKTKKLTTNWKEVGHRLQRLATAGPQRDFLAELRRSHKSQNVLSNWLCCDGDPPVPAPLPEGRLVTSYNIAGTISGRPSSSGGVDDDKAADIGPSAGSKRRLPGAVNLLNVPHGACRAMVVPDDFYDRPSDPGEQLVFLGADLEQAEAKVTAYEANCKFLIEAFEAGKNIHIVAAEIVFPGVKVVRSSDQESPYARSKRCVHMIDYGGTPFAMSPALGLPRAECATMLVRYFARCPEIPGWQDRLWSQILRTRTITTPLGRRLQFLGPLGGRDNKAKRTGLSFVPQGVVGDLTNLAMATVWRQITLPERLVLSAYDALVLLVRRKNVPQWTEVVKAAYNTPITATLTGRQYRIGVDTATGDTWDAI